VAETQQVLVAQGLRGRVRLQTDGQMRTGWDVVVAALLGAEETAFSTAPLIATGCIMMRVCHLNTCPVGIATQDPELRRRFAGTPDHVVAYFVHVAEEVRRLMAGLGVRRFDDLVGRVELLERDLAVRAAKARHVDLAALLAAPQAPPDASRRRAEGIVAPPSDTLDHALIADARAALEHGEAVCLERPVRNVDRTVGGLLSHAVTEAHGEEGLAEGTIDVTLRGSAGQSVGAWLAPGVTLTLRGEANDYAGKGLSGGILVVRPFDRARGRAEEQVIAGNTLLYGATAGRAFFRGRVGERFAVRNSGACTVVEGVGDHGCEYMTGGRVVVLGPAGRNFAAGMSGGVAYVLDADGAFPARCNADLVELEAPEDEDLATVAELVAEHARRTSSPVAERVLERWEELAGCWVKVMPRDYKRALQELARERDEQTPAATVAS
jgi:glutamate synthase domain-containing protein 3